MTTQHNTTQQCNNDITTTQHNNTTQHNTNNTTQTTQHKQHNTNNTTQQCNTTMQHNNATIIQKMIQDLPFLTCHKIIKFEMNEFLNDQC
jgi:hypothetical protein